VAKIERSRVAELKRSISGAARARPPERTSQYAVSAVAAAPLIGAASREERFARRR